MDFFEKEMRSLFEKSKLMKDAKYCGKMAIAKPQDGLVLKFEFATNGCANDYVGIRAKVMSVTCGVIDSHVFLFSDIIGDKNNGTGKVKPYLWEGDVKSCWNVPVTEEEKQKIARSVLDYAEMFVSPDMALRL